MKTKNKEPVSELKLIAGTIALTPVLLFFTMITMGGGHGTYIFGKLLYPISMIISGLHHQITDLAFWIGIIQIPIYGLILIVARRLNRLKRSVILLTIFHLVMFVVSISIAKDF